MRGVEGIAVLMDEKSAAEGVEILQRMKSGVSE